MIERLRRAEPDPYWWLAPVYDPLVGPFLRPLRNSLQRIARSGNCRRILDVGCGTGEQAELLASAGFEVAGVDLSPAMLLRARERRHSRVRFHLADARRLPFASGSFDCALMSLVLHEMAQRTRLQVLGETLRVLGADGKIIVLDYLAAKNLRSALSLGLLGWVERFAGREHFHNFRHFMRIGGLDGFLATAGMNGAPAEKYFQGAMGIILLEKHKRRA